MIEGPTWAYGCGLCNNGIVLAPALTGAVVLHQERLVQSIKGQIIFCECDAGERYRAGLAQRRWKLVEAARRDPKLADYAARLTHPDIEHAEAALERFYAEQPAPTIHE